MVYASSSSSTTTAIMTTTTVATTANVSSNSQPNFLYRQASSSSSIRRNSNSSKSINTSRVESEKESKRPNFQHRTSSSSSNSICVNSSSIKSSNQEGIITEERQKCVEAKEALCRRMGALFLRHRVEKLADDVERMQEQNKRHCPFQKRNQQNKTLHPIPPKNLMIRSNSFGSDSGGDNSSITNTVTTSTDFTTLSGGSDDKIHRSEYESTTKNSNCEWKGFSCKKKLISTNNLESRGGKCKSWCKDVSTKSSNSPSQIASKPKSVKRIIVADASLLIYSLRTVHEWLKMGDCQIIVPCEALSTLDVLKKGEHTLNWAARRATRFLDEKFSSLTADAGDDAEVLQYSTSNGTLGRKSDLLPGLFPQGLQQKIHLTENSNEDEKLFQNLGISISDLKHAPLASIKTFTCALYFIRKYQDNDQIDCSLAISLPPPHLDFDQEAKNSFERSSNLRFAERADGNLILHWSKVLGLTNNTNESSLVDQSCHQQKSRLIVAPTAASWLTVPIAGSNPIE